MLARNVHTYVPFSAEEIDCHYFATGQNTASLLCSLMLTKRHSPTPSKTPSREQDHAFPDNCQLRSRSTPEYVCDIKSYTQLKSLLHPRSHRPQVAVNFPRRATKNQAYNCLSSNVDVLESAKDVNFGVCKHNASFTGVFDSELCLPVLTSYTSNSTP